MNVTGARAAENCKSHATLSAARAEREVEEGSDTDEDCQIHFLISPFFFYCSLLWWAYVNPQTYKLLASLKPENLKDVLSIVAATGAATLPLGYSIESLARSFRVVLWVDARVLDFQQIV